MLNPWLELPETQPFLLTADRGQTAALVAQSEPHRLHLELLPEPYLGRPDAPVVLLNLNPGFGDSDHDWHARASFVEASRRSLRHEASEYPFYLLDPAVTGSPGYRWWTAKTRSLIGDCGQRAVANGLLCVEYFPYHSRNFNAHKLHLASQEYGEYLVRQAIGRGAYIVTMRAKRPWHERVPELVTYAGQHADRSFQLKNPQNVTISPGNLPEGAYSALVAAIREGTVPV